MTIGEEERAPADKRVVRESAERLSPRAVERRARILETASRLIGEYGYDGVSMRTIAAQSGVVEKTLYNIYGTKDRLIAAAARQRSSGVFEAAARSAPEGGWPMLRAFVRLATGVAFSNPRTSKAMALVLLEHSELVGMDQVYQSWVGQALDQMEATGMLEAHCPHGSVIRLIRLSIMTAAVLWSKGELADEEFEPYILTRVVETLLPSVRAEQQGEMMAELRAARLALAIRFDAAMSPA